MSAAQKKPLLVRKNHNISILTCLLSLRSHLLFFVTCFSLVISSFILLSYMPSTAMAAPHAKKVLQKEANPPKASQALVDKKKNKSSVKITGLQATDKSLTYTDKKSRAHQLQFHGKGRRKKRIAFINFKVYDISLYTPKNLVSEKSAFKILAAPELAVVIDPLRSFSGDKMKSSVLESFKINSIDLKSSHQKFISLISKNKIKKGQKIILLGHKGPKHETLYLQQKNELRSIQGGKGFVSEIFAIWLGKIEDNQLKEVKKDLLN